MKLFKTNPLDFLVKPFKAEEIISVIVKGMDRLNKLNYIFKYKQGHNTNRKEIKDII